MDAPQHRVVWRLLRKESSEIGQADNTRRRLGLLVNVPEHRDVTGAAAALGLQDQVAVAWLPGLDAGNMVLVVDNAQVDRIGFDDPLQAAGKHGDLVVVDRAGAVHGYGDVPERLPGAGRQ